MDTPDSSHPSSSPEQLHLASVSGQETALGTGAMGSARVAALEMETAYLWRHFNAVVVALIVLALGVNLFFFKQMRLVQQQVNEQRPVVQRAEAEFRRNRHPEISRFVAGLQAYGASHREFQTGILDRYRAVLPQYFNLPPQAPVRTAPLAPLTNPLAPAAR